MIEVRTLRSRVATQKNGEAEALIVNQAQPFHIIIVIITKDPVDLFILSD